MRIVTGQMVQIYQVYHKGAWKTVGKTAGRGFRSEVPLAVGAKMWKLKG
jgi:hypothetical protein